MQFKIFRHTQHGILAGATHGRKLCSRFLEEIEASPTKCERLILDFEGIEVATASCLRECVLEFRDVVRRRWPSYYPVVANANKDVVDELRILLEPRGDVLVLCQTMQDEIVEWSILGDLDPMQELTFRLVGGLGEADAASLKDLSVEGEVGRTAWNNRLASLAKLGLLVESTRGRSKKYRTLFQTER